MTTTIATPPAAPTTVARSGVAPVRLIKAELLKIWTTNSWWIFGVLAVAFTGLALLINLLQADSEISYAREMQDQPPPSFGGIGPDGQPMTPEKSGMSPQDIQRMTDEYYASIDVARIVLRSAANVYTSGQFFGLLFMVILGSLVVTNEFFHQTATTTFLTTPRRTSVITSKLISASLIAAGFWVLSTVISLGVGSAFFAYKDVAIPFGDWAVTRSILMNLLAYVIWAVLGVGLGVLIRSQLGASLTGAPFYLLGFPVAFLFFGLVRTYIIEKDWVWQWIAVVPGVASQIMISPERMQISYGENGPVYGPQWWVGALILVGYGVVAGVIGTLITRKRDIS
jgi:ABC-type transport system involved in multi-copper enzyme maturation permease subunit